MLYGVIYLLDSIVHSEANTTSFFLQIMNACGERWLEQSIKNKIITMRQFRREADVMEISKVTIIFKWRFRSNLEETDKLNVTS